ncbi:type IX secretion system sortase PorU [Epilithonimonas mollis]|uniref:Peptidase family C25 n=1 Tax=Epilithonimonas mollis TaxID=216903 RepID=A0A1M6SIC7_9FLAO|nr:type IX secretion system sortase PorU [Epilithonimonas mollis]SHK44455.1 Peptidase family C25 [Epilithonimonas mollis]
MKFKIYSVALFLVSILGFSQKITLEWKGAKEMDYGSEKIVYPFFTNYNFLVEANSVYVNLNIKTDNLLKIDQFQWEELSIKDTYDLNVHSLSPTPIAGVNYFFNDIEGTQNANVKVEALKVEKNKIYKLVSFNIVTTNQKVAALYKGSNKFGSSENPLKSGTFYKIKVDKSGIFKITKQFLQQNGINPSSINPKNFRIYGNGGLMLPEFNQENYTDPNNGVSYVNLKYNALQENAIQVVGEDDGVWNDNDFAIFYAQGPNGYNIFDRTNGNGKKRNDHRLFSPPPPNNFVNIYEDYSYYFINFDIGQGKRVQTVDTNTPSELITRYDDYQYINEEKFNLIKLGRIWTGDVITGNKELVFTTKTPIQPDDRIIFRTQAIGLNAQMAQITFSVNGSQDIKSIGNDPKAVYVPLQHSGALFDQSGNTIKFNYTPNAGSNPNAKFYFDYAEVQYKEDLNFNNSQMNFRDFDIETGSGDLYGFSVKNASELEQIWDVSDITNAKKVTNKNSQNSTFNFGYIANDPLFNNEFTAFKSSAAFEPKFVGRIENQDLASLKNIDYLMITQPAYIPQAERLAAYHRAKNGYNVQVVDVNKIYNEFSSGSKDITAIRDFITKLNTPTGSLKYVFLLGDTSYDFKNRIANNTDVIPSYQSEASANFSASYVTDDYFVMTRPQTTSTVTSILPDLPIGRLPADSPQEAKIMIDKTLAYYNALPGQSNPFGEWRMKLDFVADDDTDGSGPQKPDGTDVKKPFHNLVEYAISQSFSNTDKPEYNIRKLYMDAFPAVTSAGGQRFPQVNQAISNDVGNSLYLFYFGHGGVNGWAQERILTSTEIQGFNNFTPVYSRFPLVSTITCEFTLWDEPSTNSAGEQMIKLPTGGAATMITSSREISVDYGRKFTPMFTKHLFTLNSANQFLSLGDAHLNARKEYYYKPDIGYGAAAQDPFKVNFLGDPAMRLSRPKQLLKIDNIETPVPNQIRALDFVKVTGRILKSDGATTDNTFKGRVVINIFDKKIEKTTLNNDNTPDLSDKMTYLEEPSAIVKASGKVENGIYTVEFYVPKDINYTIGDGRILAYAENFVDAKENAFDVFTNQVQKVGDINPDGINDSEPPSVNLYMNNTNFANGGITDQNPTLLACVKDNMGINSTGAGIGHDITFILDGNVINTTSVNDYFSSGDGNGCSFGDLQDYQKGSVTFPFRNLTPGEHQLVFKVWDINNNSTSSTLNFVVKDETENKLTVNRLLNWPNPFTNKTYVQFEHNCDDILDVNVQIYTITGKIVRTISTSVSAEPTVLQGFRTPRQAIEWDGKDDFGDTVAKGTYIFKIFARSQNQEKCSGSATAVEKMVLLK